MTQGSGSDQVLRDVEELDLRLVAVNLATGRVVAVTPSAAAMAGLSGQEMLGRDALDLVDPEDRARAEVGVAALAGGDIDFMRVHTHLAGPEGGVRGVWIAVTQIGADRMAFMSFDRSPLGNPLCDLVGPQPMQLTIGLVGPDWTIRSLSTGVSQLLGIPPADLVGRLLLGAMKESDVDRLLAATRRVGADVTVGMPVRMRNGDGGWSDVRVILGPLVQREERYFVLTPPRPAGSDRAVKLEEHLRRIAAEVQASGIIHMAPEAPALASLAGTARLTARQWEVLTRLLGGQRVTTIARELFVTESTVRNHLSAIFERLGVHSQAELISLALGGGRLSS